MAISDYLNKLKQDHKSLIDAVKNKGGDISATATLSDIAKAISSLSTSAKILTTTQSEYDKLAEKEQDVIYLIESETIVKTETRIVTEPYSVIRTNDDSLNLGTEKIIRHGVHGERTIIEEVTYVDGVLTDRKVVSNQITKNPIHQEVSVGTEVVAPTNLIEPSNVSVRYGANIVASDLSRELIGQDGKLTQLNSNILNVQIHGGGLTIAGVKTVEGQQISVEFDYEVLKGTLKTMGGYADEAYSRNTVYIDGKKADGFFWTSEPGADVDKGVGGKGTVKVDITAGQNGGAHTFTIQPNKGIGVYPVVIKIDNLKMVAK